MTTVTEAENNAYDPTLLSTEWHRSFVLTAKRSFSTNERINPLSTVYTRERELYKSGQRLVQTEYLTPAQYTMMLLKREANG